MSNSVKYSVDGDTNIEQVTGRVKKGVGEMNGQFQQLEGRIKSAFIQSFGAVAIFDKGLQMVTTGFNYLKDAVVEYAKVGDEAAKSGINAEEYQRLSYAAKQSGLSIESLTKANKEFKKFVYDAKNGGIEQTKMLIGLGFTQEEITSGNIQLSESFLRVSDALAGIQDEATKSAILMALYGAKNSDVMSMMSEGRSQLAKTFANAPLVSSKDIEDLKTLGDLIDRVKTKAKATTASGFMSFINQSSFLKSQIATMFGGPFIGNFLGLSLGAGALAKESIKTSKAEAAAPGPVPTGLAVNAAAVVEAAKGLTKPSGEFKTPEGMSATIGVGSSPILDVMNAQLEETKKQTAALNYFVDNFLGPSTRDFTKGIDAAARFKNIY